MQLQQFNPKVISITQLRRDIDVLEDVLAKNDEALVVRNQDLLFVAITPTQYQKLTGDLNKNDQIAQAVDRINAIRKKYGQGHGKNAGSQYIIKIRDEAKKRWVK